MPKNAKPISADMEKMIGTLPDLVGGTSVANVLNELKGASAADVKKVLTVGRAMFASVPWDGQQRQPAVTARAPKVSVAETVRRIQELGRRARKGNTSAMLELFMVTTSAYAEMDSVPRAQPTLFKQAFRKSIFWPTGTSALPSIKSILAKDAELRGAGEEVKKRVHSKVNLRSPGTLCAKRLLGFMSAARLGFIADRKLKRWIVPCQRLPPLSKQTFKQWWEVASEVIIREMFPNLQQKVFKSRKMVEKGSYGDAVAIVRRAALTLIPMFALMDPPSRNKVAK